MVLERHRQEVVSRSTRWYCKDTRVLAESLCGTVKYEVVSSATVLYCQDMRLSVAATCGTIKTQGCP